VDTPSNDASEDSGIDTVEAARLFATAAHGAIGQRRKYLDTPYIEHPAAVAALVSRHCPDAPAMVAAAWLHDVLEDTQVTAQTLGDNFGEEVTTLVLALSDLEGPEVGNRAVRKRLALERLVRAGARAQTIKYADLIHNTGSIVEHDPGFARLYLKEKRALLEAMTDGEASLRRLAWEVLEQAEARLRQLRHFRQQEEGERPAGR
tara:strand:- start:541 stop:1155 length:615 start_codon:yes stop_codon:yes gene_type:complete